MKALCVWLCFVSAFHCFSQSADFVLSTGAAAAGLAAAGLVVASATPPVASDRIRAEDSRTVRIEVGSQDAAPVGGDERDAPGLLAQSCRQPRKFVRLV